MTQRLAESILPLRENSLDSIHEKTARHGQWPPVGLFMDRISAVQLAMISMGHVDRLRTTP